MERALRVPYSYLDIQFASADRIIARVHELVSQGDFTLGVPVRRFEEEFARLQASAYAVGVNSGTDAIALSLRALGVGPGDEVITAPNTFIATVGAIVQVGARPVFVDVGADYTIDPELIEAVIGPRTKAVVPVHLCGRPADMPAIMSLARRRGLLVVEDAAQAIDASISGRAVGTFGATGCFSLHPLKNLNVWGDGGVIITDSAELCDRLRLLRNHGLANRDCVNLFGVNSRLDSLQAVVGLELIGHTVAVTEARISNAAFYDAAFRRLADYVKVPPRDPRVREVYHTYVVRVIERDRLLAFLLERGVEGKVHYPVPVHLQPAAADLGYKRGDFPITEAQADSIISLPVHQYLAESQLQYVVDLVQQFYRKRLRGSDSHRA